jgi:hypothetical protein
MSEDAQNNRMAVLLAEEILRTIYGDDLKGCAVSLDAVVATVREGMKLQDAQTAELLNLYNKVVEAVHVLSTPPDASKITDPQELQSLLTQRLDSIHAVAAKTIETTKFFKLDDTGNG